MEIIYQVVENSLDNYMLTTDIKKAIDASLNLYEDVDIHVWQNGGEFLFRFYESKELGYDLLLGKLDQKVSVWKNE